MSSGRDSGSGRIQDTHDLNCLLSPTEKAKVAVQVLLKVGQIKGSSQKSFL